MRPYLPRFLREGDEAELKVVVNNAGEQPLAGQADARDPRPRDRARACSRAFGLAAARRAAPFTVEPGGGANAHASRSTAPRARRHGRRSRSPPAPATSRDGELRPLPVLPGRMHLAQSRFVDAARTRTARR